MFPKYHIVFGFAFAFILWIFFSCINFLEFCIIFFSSFFMDVDHYLYYVFKKRDISLKNAYAWFIQRRKKFFSLSKEQRKRFPQIFCFLHRIEILPILFILGIYVSKYFLFVFLGFTFHMCLDIIWKIKYKDKPNKISLIYDFIQLKRLKFIEKHTSQ